MHSVSILTIGSEVLDGRVQDTNSNYLCKKLALLGLQVNYIHSCTDITSVIMDTLKFAWERSNILIISGGLGPTTDDLTRESVAAFFSRALKLDESALLEMKALYLKRGREFISTNQKQAMLPEGSKIIKNPVGTAPGFIIEEKAANNVKVLASLPGVPVELISMFEETLEPYLLKNIPNIKPVTVKGFKCFGLPEALIGAKIQELNIPESIFVSYRAAFPEVHIALKSYTNEINEYHKKAMQVVGLENIYTEDLNCTFESLILQMLEERKLSLSTVESCTGGMLSSILTGVPGSSKSYLGGVISYSNSVKSGVLGVNKTVLENHGAVSAETATAMAENCLKKLESDYAVSITGIAGPDGGTPQKPVGLYFVGIAGKNHVSAHRRFLPLKRKQIRLHASYMAMDILRRQILGIPQQADAIIPGA